MLEQVRRTIARFRMLEPGDRVVVAVSAGPDSVALVHLLNQLAPEWGLALHLFHLQHGLRGAESEADAQYVVELAAQMGLPCTVRRADITGVAAEMGTSLEAAGREVRYREMAALAWEWPATRIATGHHRNDQAETVLLRLLRGTGRQGLAGIRPARPAGYGAPPGCRLIRPLLAVPRSEIIEYCRKNGLSPRQDASNLDPRFLRNRIRHRLIPALADEYNPRIVDRLAELADILQAEEDYLETAVAAACHRHGLRPGPEGVVLPRAALLDEPLAVARRLVRTAAAALGASLDYAHVESVIEAAALGTGTVELDLPGGLRASVAYGTARLFRPQDAPGTPQGPWLLTVPGVTDVERLCIRFRAKRGPGEITAPGAWSVALDESRLPGPLQVRTRRPGDRIWPTGMTGSKKLQDLLVDLKVPRAERDRIPVVVAGDEVVWLPGIRADRRFLATSPEHRLSIEAEPLRSV